VPGTCVIGLQWGDEAKGKLVDLMTGDFDIVVRYQGGANAGHTVVVGDETYKLHHIPSGILNSNVLNIISSGVVLNPPTILEEIRALSGRGISVSANLRISDRAHVVMPWHIAEDHALNASLVDGENIGTTLRGIGPCYRDKVGRTNAIRLGDMMRDDFAARIERIVGEKRTYLAAISTEATPLDVASIHREYAAYADQLRPFVVDSTAMLLDAVEDDKAILYEGAQGALLDIDHGTFPFVTSSNSSGVGVSAGAGVPGRWINHVIGVIKAYSTRVGGGPFPTEQENEAGQLIRDLGNEYGTTTGRPRRCGWFDAVAVRYSARLSGVDALSVMMLDVLSQLPVIKVCTGYELDGEISRHFPSHSEDLRRVKPVYETIEGWMTDVTEMREYSQLPDGAKRYLDRVQELVGKPVEITSVGPDREQTIMVP
jgi:adenylosuccinate synthase